MCTSGFTLWVIALIFAPSISHVCLCLRARYPDIRARVVRSPSTPPRTAYRARPDFHWKGALLEGIRDSEVSVLRISALHYLMAF